MPRTASSAPQTANHQPATPMRIISGEFAGRNLRAPPVRRARPTAGRVREAWFDILATELPGALVLDLFAGSGALGLEALSRGARRAEFVESDSRSLKALKENIGSLAVAERTTIHRKDALRFAAGLGDHEFDLAFADPPYDTDHAVRLVEIFRERRFARILGVEHRATMAITGDDMRRYGDACLTFCYAP
ncbi:MAG: 16S rRNA (guanine(966)-N(2))-methyltransferase RsmD [Gemmatimonadales bacterium]